MNWQILVLFQQVENMVQFTHFLNMFDGGLTVAE